MLNGDDKDFEKLSYHNFIDNLFKKLPYNSMRAKALIFDEYFSEYYKWLEEVQKVNIEVKETKVTKKKKTLFNKF